MVSCMRDLNTGTPSGMEQSSRDVPGSIKRASDAGWLACQLAACISAEPGLAPWLAPQLSRGLLNEQWLL